MKFVFDNAMYKIPYPIFIIPVNTTSILAIHNTHTHKQVQLLQVRGEKRTGLPCLSLSQYITGHKIQFLSDKRPYTSHTSLDAQVKTIIC